MEQDETMSQDQAFPDDMLKEPTFKFDSDGTESESNASQAEQTVEKAAAASSAENDDDEEARVPYDRFEQVVSQREEARERIAKLESELAETKKQSVQNNSEEMPPEWIQLYGNSEISRQAWNIQLARERRLQENAENMAYQRFQNEQKKSSEREVEKEDAIDTYLSSVAKASGKRLSQSMADEVLSIVDEYSPVGSDGKYIAWIPAEKALEIYNMRQAQKGKATIRSRNQVASLAGSASENEAGSTQSSASVGWDDWRNGL